MPGVLCPQRAYRIGSETAMEPQDLQEGDSVALEVTIESSQKRYKLNGQVVSRPPSESVRGRFPAQARCGTRSST